MGRRKKAETYEPHDLLDEDCRHYIESAITNYHNICKNFFDHIEFLNFWFNHIEKAPTPQNTALCAFGFFKQDSLAENYLKKYANTTIICVIQLGLKVFFRQNGKKAIQ